MKTSTTASARPSTASGTRLRRLSVIGLAGLVAPVALAACSGEPTVTAAPTAPSAAATAPATPTTTSETTTSSSPTVTATALPRRADRSIRQTIKDPVLGHTITATKLARNVPFPKGNPVAQENFELVGVYLVVDMGSRYTAPVDSTLFTLKTSSSPNVVPATTEFNKSFGGPLQTGAREELRRGWVFFKLDRGWDGQLQLSFNRPAYAVSTTGQKIPAKTFTVKIWG